MIIRLINMIQYIWYIIFVRDTPNYPVVHKPEMGYSQYYDIEDRQVLSERDHLWI